MKIYLPFLVFLLITACSTSAPSEITDQFPLTVRGGDSASFAPPPAKGAAVVDAEKPDVVIVGAGLAGLSSADFLTNQHLKVLILEKEHSLGGLAAGEQRGQFGIDRGAAYFTDAYEEEQKILDAIGLGDYAQKYAIPDPIDSYFVRGHFYPDIWVDETVRELPAGFAVFKFMLQQADRDHLIPNQPFEEFANLALDGMNGQEWVEGMPKALRAKLPELEAAAQPQASKATASEEKDPKKIYETAKQVLGRYEKEKGRDGMAPVIELLDLYCRSALGNVTKNISAVALANFYISEIVTRFTTPFGTGMASQKMQKLLEARPALAGYKTDTPVTKIVNRGSRGVDVYYNSAGTLHKVNAKYVVFSAQLGVAPKLIEGLKEGAPEQAKLMSELGYSHYSVHSLFLDGHPFRASYDTWIRRKGYTEEDPTDFILARWMDPAILGYHGYRDFKKDPADNESVISIYHPLPQSMIGKKYDEQQSKEIALHGLRIVNSVLSDLPGSLYRGPLHVVKMETNRWPFSVHVAAPGHFLRKAKILRKPFGRIFFAHSNIGTPAFEEALFRGHCAANNILLRLKRSFKMESWTLCPVEAK
jgi:hypothetical protein